MNSTLKRITALLLALALSLSLSAVGLAAQEDVLPAASEQSSAEQSAAADSADASPEQNASIDPADQSTPTDPDASAPAADAGAQTGAEDRSAGAADSAEASPDASVGGDNSGSDASAEADGSAEVPGEGESVPQTEDAVTPQEEPQEAPAAIWWQTEEGYGEKVAYVYNGQERKPGYRLMRDGAEVERKPEWTEQWYLDEACTVPATEFVSVGTRFLRLMEGDVVRAQGGYSIVKEQQHITVNSAATRKLFQAGAVFSLGAGTTGDGALSFESSDPEVLTVNDKGECTMKSRGAATITVTASETDRYQSAQGAVEVRLYVRARNLGYSKSYKKGKYYKALLKAQLWGSDGENAVDVALSQLGYKEGRKSGQLSGNGKGVGNWTEYGRYYGLNHQPWCAIFVNWCAREAGASYSAVPKYCAVRSYHSYFRRQGRFHSWSSIRSGGYEPKKGDVILYAHSKNGVAHHIGYVLESSRGDGRVRLTTVEGNTKDAVRRVNMNLSDKSAGKHSGHYILGVASPNW